MTLLCRYNFVEKFLNNVGVNKAINISIILTIIEFLTKEIFT